ncbi:MAG: ABC transporter ATP-binding protein [Cyanobacteria bacterium P01_G01_bin.19]
MVIKVKKINKKPNQKESDIVLDIDRVSKKFCRDLKHSLFYGIQDIASEIMCRSRRSHKLRDREFWALKDVSFQLKKGEALGLIGANGAGKSTLLRIISGLINPDTGSIKVKGRVAPLIALSAGFNPILTGRENIYANMSILGMTKAEIDQNFDAVVDFAELWEAIDAPVQTYSSGMSARLGFACAIHVEPEILLIDEVLSVGDIKFRMKCHQRLAKLRKQGTAFILVSHNSHSILNICNSAIYLEKGRLLAAGDTESVIRKYEEDLVLSQPHKHDSDSRMFLPPKTPAESSGLDILEIYFCDRNEQILDVPLCGEPISLCVKYKSVKYIDNLNLGIKVRKILGEQDLVLYLTAASDNCLFNIAPGIGEIQLKMPYLGMTPGKYTTRIYLRSGVCTFDVVESFYFTVDTSQIISQCLFYQPHTWTIKNVDITNPIYNP